jgi:hypothetical protein
VDFAINVDAMIRLRSESPPDLDMQTGVVKRDGDVLTGKIGPGYPVWMQRVDW